MVKRLDLVKDLSLQTFINHLGGSLVSQITVTPFEFDFYIVKGNDPNAFAIPGGHIFVTTGLLAMAENETEVAGVLSHEIAHVTQRHISTMMERAKRINILTLAAMIAGAIAGRGGKGTEAVTATAAASAEAMMLKYTRDNEVDADQNSLQLMAKAGYDGQSLVSFLKKMERYSLVMAPKVPQYLSTHPALENRVVLLENILALDPKPPGSFSGGRDYKRIQMRALIEERDPSAAVSYFETLLKEHPDETEGLFGLGLAYQKAGRWDRAMEAFQEAFQKYPGDAEARSEQGVSAFFGGKLDRAIEILGPAAQTNGLKGQYYLGRAYQEKGDFQKALELYLRVKAVVPAFVDVYTNLGSTYGRMGQKGLSHYYFGQYFERRGDRTNALLHYRTSLDLLSRGTPEREDAQRRIRELTQPR
jgi:predicted Zn-dependent protease